MTLPRIDSDVKITSLPPGWSLASLVILLFISTSAYLYYGSDLNVRDERSDFTLVHIADSILNIPKVSDIRVLINLIVFIFWT